MVRFGLYFYKLNVTIAHIYRPGGILSVAKVKVLSLQVDQAQQDVYR